MQVNANVAARLLSEQEKATQQGTAGTPGGGRGGVESDDEDVQHVKSGPADLLNDDRFKAMFEDPDFVVNEESEEYRLLHPNAGMVGMCA